METDSPTALPAPAQPEAFRQLRTLVHACAVSILILTGTVFVFLYRQVVSIRNNTAELAHYIIEYDSSMQDVHRRFAQFRQQHPDFAQIYFKYFGTNQPPPGPQLEPVPKVVPAPPRPAELGPQNQE